MADTLETQVTSVRSSTEKQVAELGPWFHNLHLPDGTQTAPNHRLGDFPAVKWAEVGRELSDNLSGWTALDVGCNAGYYSFELAKRGAEVLAIDVNERYLDQARWAAGQFGLTESVDFKCLQVYDLAKSEQRFDLVLFLGVFYHLRYPLLALDILAGKVNRRMVFQSLTIPGDGDVDVLVDHDFAEREEFLNAGWPKMAFIEGNFAGDPTNWWIPNHAGVEAMLRSAGMRITAHPSHDVYVCEPNDATTTVAQSFVSEQLRSATGSPRLRTPHERTS